MAYQGPREFRGTEDNPALKNDLDRLAAENVRQQPALRRSVVRWSPNVPIALDSTLIVFAPTTGATLVLPRPEAYDDGRTVVIAVASGSGIVTVEAPVPGAAADVRTLDQPGAYTFTIIDRVYYVATAISGSIPPTVIENSLEITGPSLVGRVDSTSGTTTEIVALAPLVIADLIEGDALFLQMNSIDPSFLAISGGTAPNFLLGVVANSATVVDQYLVDSPLVLTPVGGAGDGGVIGVADVSIDLTKLSRQTGAGVLGTPNLSGSQTVTFVQPSATAQVLLGSSVDSPIAMRWGAITPAHTTIADSDTITVDYLLGHGDADSDATYRAFAVDGNVVPISNGTYQVLSVATAGITSNELASNSVTRAKLSGSHICALAKGSDQTNIPTTGATITWDSEILDASSMHSGSSGTVTFPVAADYKVTFTGYTNSAGGAVTYSFRLNDAEIHQAHTNAGGQSVTSVFCVSPGAGAGLVVFAIPSDTATFWGNVSGSCPLLLVESLM